MDDPILHMTSTDWTMDFLKRGHEARREIYWECGGDGKREWEVNMTKIHCLHVWPFLRIKMISAVSERTRYMLSLSSSLTISLQSVLYSLFPPFPSLVHHTQNVSRAGLTSLDFLTIQMWGSRHGCSMLVVSCPILCNSTSYSWWGPSREYQRCGTFTKGPERLSLCVSPVTEPVWTSYCPRGRTQLLILLAGDYSIPHSKMAALF